jgi:hypothetical protein
MTPQRSVTPALSSRDQKSKDTNPRQLEYYPRCWRTLLGEAMVLFRGSIAARNAFPTQEQGRAEAKECLQEVFHQFCDDGVQLESGYSIGEDMEMLVR